MITMQDILKHLQVHVPFDQLLQKHLDKILRERINPEIAFNSAILDGFKEPDYASAATILREAGHSITFHGPFMDLRPGAHRSRDPAGDASSASGRSSRSPPGFARVQSSSTPPTTRDTTCPPRRKWLENSLDTWRSPSRLRPGNSTPDHRPGERLRSRIPATSRLLLDALLTRARPLLLRHGARQRLCGAPASRPGSTGLGSRLGEIHLHDNHGAARRAPARGGGDFPFARLFAILRSGSFNPILTVEAHSEQNLGENAGRHQGPGIRRRVRQSSLRLTCGRPAANRTPAGEVVDMLRYVAKRLLFMIPLLFGITIICFTVMHLAPGSPTDLQTQMNPRASAEMKERLRAMYDLDKPLHEQYCPLGRQAGRPRPGRSPSRRTAGRWPTRSSNGCRSRSC
ncbi:MAG: hypothetical protein MZU91_04625 [Desulfosudis oleivorans]|nr:hypothetical protein [Desulfosudis oleivorans]